MAGHKKRKQDVDHSASDSDVPDEKPTKSKSTTAKEKAPAKPKTAKKPRIDYSEEKSPPRHEESTVQVHKNAEGDKYVDLGKMRRATVSKFKGHVYINIREYYAGDGDAKPGKKGISLTVEQWEALRRSVNTIDSLVAETSGK